MTDEIRKQIEAAADAWWVQGDMHSHISFKAGAEFGFGLLQQQLAKYAQDSLSYQWDLRKECDALAAKLQQEQQWSGEREDALAKQIDALAARLQELEAAAEALAQALESRQAVPMSYMDEPCIYTSFSAFDDLTRAVQNYRKLAAPKEP